MALAPEVHQQESMMPVPRSAPMSEKVSETMQATFCLENISKSFGSVHANKDISLDIHAGKILALLGENGAGKSTLMSILAGQLQPDSGTLYKNGSPVHFASTQQAIDHGIGMVYQHFKLVEAMTVAENIFLGSTKKHWLRSGYMYKAVEELAARYSMRVDPRAAIHDLSMGEKQQVEILKLLYRKSTLLIFDEPTAVLTPTESEGLFLTMQEMASQGKAIVFISHKLEEVMSVADQVAILKQGQVIDQMGIADVESSAELAERMVGRPVLLEVEREELRPRQLVLQVEKLNVDPGNPDRTVDLEIRQGEVFGLIGVAGNGQKALVEMICGLRAPQRGRVDILGKSWKEFFSKKHQKAREDAPLSYIPEDRQGLATCPTLDLIDNFLLTTNHSFAKGIWLGKKEARVQLEKLVKSFDIRPPNVDACGWQLSGGNLQKLVLAREFYCKPRLIVAEQPTQGLDIAAAEEVWKVLLKARLQAGILLVTGDLSEALALSDRLGVMYNGRLVATFDADDEEMVARIPQYMAGINHDESRVSTPEQVEQQALLTE